MTATTPTKYTFTVPFTRPTITGTVSIVGYLKSGTVSGTAAGLRITGGGVYPSRMDFNAVIGEDATAVGTRLTTHTNLTLAGGAHGGELDPVWVAASNGYATTDALIAATNGAVDDAATAAAALYLPKASGTAYTNYADSIKTLQAITAGGNTTDQGLNASNVAATTEIHIGVAGEASIQATHGWPAVEQALLANSTYAAYFTDAANALYMCSDSVAIKVDAGDIFDVGGDEMVTNFAWVGREVMPVADSTHDIGTPTLAFRTGVVDELNATVGITLAGSRRTTWPAGGSGGTVTNHLAKTVGEPANMQATSDAWPLYFVNPTTHPSGITVVRCSAGLSEATS